MKRYFLLTSLLFFTLCTQAQMTTRVVRDSLFIPWELVYGPDDHIWFTQKNGYVCRLEPVSGHIDTLRHETETVVQGEGGMLGLAIHPQFPAEPYVYVAYNYSQGGYQEKVVRYTYSGNSLGSPQTLLDGIDAASIHNGCRLLIVGDKLFITTGDAADQPSAQNLQSLNGKVLRINLDGTIPADNPIAGSPIWSWGHRNPQGMIYANNRMYASEHGPNTDDEVNIIEKGRNYGWPTVRGFCDQPAEATFCADSNVVEPIRAWTPTIATCGLAYYNHSMFPAWQNALLMATLKDERLYVLKLNNGFDSIVSVSTLFNSSFGRLRGICTAPDGKVYISTSNSQSGGTSTLVDKIIEIYDPNFTAVQSINEGNALTIYPNPTGDYTMISVPESLMPARLQYVITDEQGRVVQNGKLKGNNTQLSIKQFAKGTYSIKISTKTGKMYSGKILKQ